MNVAESAASAESAESKPWRGVQVAAALPFRGDLTIDFDAYAEHVAFLAAGGCDGICANGSLGEYQTLSDDERARVVTTAIEAAPEGFGVMPGVGAYGALQSRRWAEHAAESGAQSVLLLPPNTYRADEATVVEHYREVAKVGLPIVAYNNPFDTKVDLTPPLLARLHGEGLIVGVKEFTGDVRRAYRLAELAPELDLIIGTDDVLLELGIAGAVGWIAGLPNALPETSVRLYRLATTAATDTARSDDLAEALPIYRELHALLRWDATTEFVQAIKLMMDLAGRKGGDCRPPRTPLPDESIVAITAEMEQALDKGYR